MVRIKCLLQEFTIIQASSTERLQTGHPMQYNDLASNPRFILRIMHATFIRLPIVTGLLRVPVAAHVDRELQFRFLCSQEAQKSRALINHGNWKGLDLWRWSEVDGIVLVSRKNGEHHKRNYAVHSGKSRSYSAQSNSIPLHPARTQIVHQRHDSPAKDSLKHQPPYHSILRRASRLKRSLQRTHNNNPHSSNNLPSRPANSRSDLRTDGMRH